MARADNVALDEPDGEADTEAEDVAEPVGEDEGERLADLGKAVADALADAKAEPDLGALVKPRPRRLASGRGRARPRAARRGGCPRAPRRSPRAAPGARCCRPQHHHCVVGRQKNSFRLITRGLQK